MSIFDLNQRANAVLKKYEKYDAPVNTKAAKTDDPFLEEYYEVEAEVERLMEAASEVTLESNRAVIAAKNGEIRRVKNVLLTDAIDVLEKKVKKGKGVTKALIAERQNMVKEMIDKVYAVPDGMSSAPVRRPMRHGTKGTKKDPIILNNQAYDASGGGDSAFQHTDGTQGFEKEKEQAFKRQDEVIDRIGRGVETLDQIARGMGEEVDRQNPVIDDIEHQMDKVTSQLKTNNAKLKGLVHRMRSARNFCVDVILICVLLAIGAYIYATFAKKK